MKQDVLMETAHGYQNIGSKKDNRCPRPKPVEKGGEKARMNSHLLNASPRHTELNDQLMLAILIPKINIFHFINRESLAQRS